MYRFLLFACLLFVACESEQITSDDYQHWVLPERVTNHEDIPNFIEKAELGRELFFAKTAGHTSLDSFSCATCHDPKFGFTAGEAQSGGAGFFGPAGKRKPIPKIIKRDAPPVLSPSAMSVVAVDALLWSGKASGRVEDDPFYPIDSTHIAYNNWYHTSAAIVQAMFAQDVAAHDMRFLLGQISNDNKLFGMFSRCYPGVDKSKLMQDINVAECIAAFELSHLVPYDSKFQEWLSGNENAISQYAAEGLMIAEKKCAFCHEAPYGTDGKFHNKGFGNLINEFHDGSHNANFGRFEFTGHSEDKYKFATPRLMTNLPDHGAFGHGGTYGDLFSVIKACGRTTDEESRKVEAWIETTVDKGLRNMTMNN